MKRLALWLALFLSLGFNLGLVVSRLTPEQPTERRPVENPAGASAQAFDDASTAGSGDETPAAGDMSDMSEASDAPRRVPPRLERVVVRVADDLGLEGADRERFFDLQRDFFARTLRARRQQRRLEAEVRRLLISNDPDRAEVEAALERVVRTQGEVERAFLDHYFGARELLDDGQMHRYKRFLGHLRRASREMSQREAARAERPGLHQDRPRRPRP